MSFSLSQIIGSLATWLQVTADCPGQNLWGFLAFSTFCPPFISSTQTRKDINQGHQATFRREVIKNYKSIFLKGLSHDIYDNAKNNMNEDNAENEKNDDIVEENVISYENNQYEVAISDDNIVGSIS